MLHLHAWLMHVHAQLALDPSQVLHALELLLYFPRRHLPATSILLHVCS